MKTTMTSPLRSLCLIVLALGTVLSACKKEETQPPTPPADGGGGGGNSTPSTTPSFTDADGVLAAVRVFTTQSTPIGTIDITMGVASAAFSNDGFSTFANVGDVSCNGSALTRQSNNSYAYTPTATEPTGIDLTASNEVTWTVGGGAGFAGFTRTIMGPFPTVAPITSGETVVRANGYTLSTSSVLGADSVIFTLGSLVRTLPGNATSCSFSAGDLAGLSTGTSIAQIVGYTSSNETIGGKKMYFVKEASRSRSITIQ
jgi:hypothetical protein